MKVIVCLDKNNGMMFNSRRQSRDRNIIEDILKSIKNNKLYVSGYSAVLFENIKNKNIIINDNMLNAAKADDYCFVEDKLLSPDSEKISEITVYFWNKTYPSDRYLDINIDALGFTLYESSDFKGYSHDMITKNVCKRNCI